MGFSRKRIGRDGRPRYTAYFLDAQQRERSAGTYGSRRDADSAWQGVEASFAAGRPADPRRGRITFQHYVEQVWFPDHVIEVSTRQSYHYVLGKHLMPTFGPMRMGDILPAHVRKWVTAEAAAGVSPAGIRHAKIVLSAIFTTALNDLVIGLNPCKGVKTPPVPVPEYRILTPEEFNRVSGALATPAARLLVELLVESGLRWGEATELRVRDLQFGSGILTVARAVVQVDPQFHPDGERFLVKPYPKGRRSRRLRLSPHLVTEVAAHVSARQLGPDDLLFSLPQLLTTQQIPLQAPVDRGLTAPNQAGRSYRHGSLSAYTAGRCRCELCRRTFAIYRAERRASGLDQPRQPRLPGSDGDGHIPNQWFRTTIWNPACSAAGITPAVRLQDLRHSHASWLLAGGADLQVVKERLGHRSLVTTEKYLHTLPSADETALRALALIRKQLPAC